MARRVTKEKASHIVNRALEMDSSKEIERLLMAHYPFETLLSYGRESAGEVEEHVDKI